MRGQCSKCQKEKNGVRVVGRQKKLVCLKCHNGKQKLTYTEKKKCDACGKQKPRVHVHRDSGLELCRPCYRTFVLQKNCLNCHFDHRDPEFRGSGERQATYPSGGLYFCEDCLRAASQSTG